MEVTVRGFNTRKTRFLDYLRERFKGLLELVECPLNFDIFDCCFF
jgi:hypothetical protein